MKDKVNNEVKHREPWRLFAQTMLNRAAKEYLEVFFLVRFMLFSLKVRDGKLKEIIATNHVDGTVRPQILERDVNPKYYKLIENFESEKSIPVVLNTSFNDKGKPIVLTPQDAIRTFFSTGLDAIAIGNFR